jgi:hypothetical protein
MVNVVAMVVLYTSYLAFTVAAHGEDRFVYHRVVLLLGLAILAVTTLAQRLVG